MPNLRVIGSARGRCHRFLRLGREGFRVVQQSARDVATRLAAGIAELGMFRLLTAGNELPFSPSLPKRKPPSLSLMCQDI
jgi:glutamate/tyrosine decarboxylase-like PLP-dependent enzyme